MVVGGVVLHHLRHYICYGKKKKTKEMGSHIFVGYAWNTNNLFFSFLGLCEY